MNHVCEYKVGGACKEPGCRMRCPHPLFEMGAHGWQCMTCQCLQPLEGSPDFYELPCGPPQPCTLTDARTPGDEQQAKGRILRASEAGRRSALILTPIPTTFDEQLVKVLKAKLAVVIGSAETT